MAYGYLQPDGRWRCRECRRMWITEYRDGVRGIARIPKALPAKYGTFAPIFRGEPYAPGQQRLYEDQPPVAPDEAC